MYLKYISLQIIVAFTIFLLIGCSTSKDMFVLDDMKLSERSVNDVLTQLPDYKESLQTISGSGRTIVSEPGGNERVTVRFQSNRNESLLNVRNSLGIEGGQIYVDRDSLLIFNRIDKFAEKVAIREGKLTSVGSIASMNMLDLFNYTLNSSDVAQIYEDSDHIALLLTDQSYVVIPKSNFQIKEVVHANPDEAPFSRIEYDGYAEIDGFILPRRITVYSSDGQSRAALLVQNLELNAELPNLTITIPDDIPIYR